MTTVCLAATDCMSYPTGGGHLWAYLNWACGLRDAGCEVIWLEGVGAELPADVVRTNAARLRERLTPYGLGDAVIAYPWSDVGSPESRAAWGLDRAFEADLLLSFDYGAPADVVRRFRRSALVDLDPGLLQLWMADGDIVVAEHDTHFSIGETVGTPQARFPDAGRAWVYTPPCVSLREWQVAGARPDAAFTTVSQWYSGDWVGREDGYSNNKREGFLPFLDLPSRTQHPLELALNLGDDDRYREEILDAGWRLVDADSVVATPDQYRSYLQASLGELSCAKPSCGHLQNAWVSDRTLCYLASGKPVVVQHTGPSTYLPDAAGMFRFRDVDEAVRALDKVMANYDQECENARALAEAHFDAATVAGRVVERALS